jgi:hypothetical protein
MGSSAFSRARFAAPAVEEAKLKDAPPPKEGADVAGDAADAEIRGFGFRV